MTLPMLLFVAMILLCCFMQAGAAANLLQQDICQNQSCTDHDDPSLIQAKRQGTKSQSYGDNLVAGKDALYPGDDICASPGGEGYFCFELSNDGGIRIKTHFGEHILTLLDTSEQFGIRGGDYVAFLNGQLGLFKSGWKKLWTLADVSNAVKLQMRHDGNLMLMSEDVDANQLDNSDGRVLWQLFEYTGRQLPDCLHAAFRQLPCRDVYTCNELCNPTVTPLECADWGCLPYGYL